MLKFYQKKIVFVFFFVVYFLCGLLSSILSTKLAQFPWAISIPQLHICIFPLKQTHFLVSKLQGGVLLLNSLFFMIFYKLYVEKIKVSVYVTKNYYVCSRIIARFKKPCNFGKSSHM